MSNARALALTVFGLLLTLSACAQDPEPEPLSLGGNDTSASPAPAEPTTSAAAPEPADSDEPVDGKVLLGRPTTGSAVEQEAATVWFGYWTEVNRMYADVEADEDALYAVATGTAATGPLDYLATLQERDERQVGGSIGRAASVVVRGDRAVVEGCFRNSALNVDRSGTAVETLTPFFTTREVLRLEGPDWRVVTSDLTSRNERCDFR